MIIFDPVIRTRLSMVTGNSGLGKESVIQFAKHNPAQIILAARTPSKAQAAIESIKAESPSAQITYLPLDLASLQSINEAADTVNETTPRLDILMNNAGIMAVPEGNTTDGFEIQLGTNHIGHFQLTKKLLPLLQKTSKMPEADVRVITLSSMGHHGAPKGGINFDDPAMPQAGTWARYGQAKLANILFAKELARRYPEIRSVSIHPGIIKTELYSTIKQNSSWLRTALALAGGLVLKSVAEGAKNQLWASTSKAVVSGNYYTPVGVQSLGTNYAQDDELAARLWTWTEDQIESKGF